jgi:hypothetical protein
MLFDPVQTIHDELDEAVLEAYGWDIRIHDISAVP